jgi:UDPglucose 6-dehydrogenase
VNSLISFAKGLNAPTGILEKVMEVNVQQPLKVLGLIKEAAGDLNEKKIAVLGLAFKPDTSDTRESPSITLVKELLKEGANVVAYDPLVKEDFNKIAGCESLKHGDSWRAAVTGASAAALMTRWPEFKEITQDELVKLMREPALIDGRRFLDKKDFTKIKYSGIGYRPTGKP